MRLLLLLQLPLRWLVLLLLLQLPLRLLMLLLLLQLLAKTQSPGVTATAGGDPGCVNYGATIGVA